MYGTGTKHIIDKSVSYSGLSYPSSPVVIVIVIEMQLINVYDM